MKPKKSFPGSVLASQRRSFTQFKAARDFLLEAREDYDRAIRGFQWPQLTEFNWAYDWFDQIADERPALVLPELGLVDEAFEAKTVSFRQLSVQSGQIANFFWNLGLQRGDRILVMLPNTVELWQVFLGAMKAELVLVPTSSGASLADVKHRVDRAGVRAVLTDSKGAERLSRGEGLDCFQDLKLKIHCGIHPPHGWIPFSDFEACGPRPLSQPRTLANHPLLAYFTSGTTSEPKLVVHTHASYPVGHLSTLYWIGLRPGDLHRNISAPGWAKHAWSNLFAPWNAEAAVVVTNPPAFDAKKELGLLRSLGVNTFCAPPTVWRHFLQAGLGEKPAGLRECVSAGEPLNGEVISQVQAAWNLSVRDGFGQTESTALLGNSPGQKLKPGSMGRPLPGYSIGLLDSAQNEGQAGEISVCLKRDRPVGLMAGYQQSGHLDSTRVDGSWYATGDEAQRDSDGYYFFVGRGDDVFKSSDYRLSPFELESALLKHPLVAESAVVPSPDPLRLSVPKAFVTLVWGQEPSFEVAQRILKETNAILSAHQRIRKIEFGALPKTVSGKIRRAELRAREAQKTEGGVRPKTEWDWKELAP